MATNNPTGEYRDSRLDMEKLLRASGPILESAVQDAIANHAPFFRQDGPDLKHVVMGVTLEDYCKPEELRKRHPYWFADYKPPTEEQVESEVIEDACLTPTPRSLARLYKSVGELRYNEILKAWGVDAARMKPGVRPEWAEKPEVKKVTDRKNNPWSKEGWNISKQGSLVQSIGIERAAEIARSVGCKIGSTKPNADPRYN